MSEHRWIKFNLYAEASKTYSKSEKPQENRLVYAYETRLVDFGGFVTKNL